MYLRDLLISVVKKDFRERKLNNNDVFYEMLHFVQHDKRKNTQNPLTNNPITNNPINEHPSALQ